MPRELGMQGNEIGGALRADAVSKGEIVKRLRKHAAHIGALTAVAAIAVGVIAASASGTTTTVQVGNIKIKVGGSFSPTKLPTNKLAPITLKVNGDISTTDGTHVPALKTLDIQFDKNGTIYTKGLPTCRLGQLTNTLTPVAKKSCGSALVGTGKVKAEVQFPDSQPVPATGTLLIFNGAPKGGKPVLLFHTYVSSPVSATVITQAVIGKAHGKYGTSTSISVPPLAGGYGSLTDFTSTIAKSWTYKGQKKNLLMAKCPTGHLFGHGDFTFVNGIQLHGDIAVPCQKG
jgi:hypothetical protein